MEPFELFEDTMKIINNFQKMNGGLTLSVGTIERLIDFGVLSKSEMNEFPYSVKEYIDKILEDDKGIEYNFDNKTPIKLNKRLPIACMILHNFINNIMCNDCFNECFPITYIYDKWKIERKKNDPSFKISYRECFNKSERNGLVVCKCCLDEAKAKYFYRNELDHFLTNLIFIHSFNYGLIVYPQKGKQKKNIIRNIDPGLFLIFTEVMKNKSYTDKQIFLKMNRLQDLIQKCPSNYEEIDKIIHELVTDIKSKLKKYRMSSMILFW